MPTITNNQILSNRGENLVSYLLSRYCLVRPVSNGTDIGVDLFCEAILENQSVGHFWIQVKSSVKDIKGFSLSREHAEYWIRQPAPVFIFLIEISEKTSASNFSINVINLVEQLIKDSDFKGKSRVFRNDLTLVPGNSLREFVYAAVPKAIARQKLVDGYIVPVRYKGKDEYFKPYDVTNAHRFTRQILKNIGRACSLLAREILSLRDARDWEKELQQIESILETFREWPNNDMPYALAMLQERAKKLESAVENY